METGTRKVTFAFPELNAWEQHDISYWGEVSFK
jgi:hypothetical protein